MQLGLESYRQVLAVGARAAGGLERHRARARGAQEVRGRAQRVRPRDSRTSELRRGALQSGLHALEPRRLRGRAARDEASARARPVLHAAEVRARDRRRVRGSRSLDRSGARRFRASRPRTSTSFAFDVEVLDSLFTELAPAAPEAVPEPAKQAPAEPVVENHFVLAHDYLAKGMLDRAVVEANRALVRGAADGGGISRSSATSSCGRGCSARRSSGIRSARIAAPTRCEAARGRDPRAAGDGSRDRGACRVPSDCSRWTASRWRRCCSPRRRAPRAGDPGAARELLRSARRLAPARADVLKEFGDVARAAGDVDGAIASYRNALDLDKRLRRRALRARAAARRARRAGEGGGVAARGASRRCRRMSRRCSRWRTCGAASGAWTRRSRRSSSCFAATRTTSTRCSRSARCCSSSTATTTRRSRSTACCASIRVTCSRSFSRGSCSPSATAIATRSRRGSA